MKSRVAVACSDPAALTVLQAVTQRLGAELEVYRDGEQAYVGLVERGADLLVVEPDLPSLDGISLCRLLRGTSLLKELPLLAVAEARTENDVVRVLDAGANDFVSKPLSPELLLVKLRQLLESPPPAPRPERAFPESPPLPYRYDRFELLVRLGTGLSGTVYDSAWVDSGKRAAVKIFRPEAQEDGAGVGRFLREVAVLSELESPHVARLRASGYAEGRFFLAMDRAPGQPLARKIRREGPLRPRAALDVCLQIADALAALGEAGLVHRDVNPNNVIVDPTGYVTLVDFGLAKGATHETLTSSGDLLGTLYYLAPEVVQGEPPTARSDLYALGGLLYEAISGKPPFRSLKSAIEIIEALHAGAPAPSLSEVCPDCDPSLVAYVSELLAPEPERRPATAAEVHAKLRSLSAQLAPPPDTDRLDKREGQGLPYPS